jgi:hypothetical protein
MIDDINNRNIQIEKLNIYPVSVTDDVVFVDDSSNNIESCHYEQVLTDLGLLNVRAVRVNPMIVHCSIPMSFDVNTPITTTI